MNRNMRAWFAPLDRMPLYPCDAGLASAAACTKAAQKLVQISAGGVPSARMRGRRMVPKLNKTSAGIFVVLTMFLALMGPTPNRNCIGILVALVMTLALMGLEPGAAAAGLDKKGSADAKNATQLYKQGSYEEAAAVFLQLSIDNPGMPVFVRNLGACYYYLRRPDPALSNLREYLVKKKDVTPEDRAEVEGWIAEMDQLRQHGSAPAAAALPVAPMPPAYAPRHKRRSLRLHHTMRPNRNTLRPNRNTLRPNRNTLRPNRNILRPNRNTLRPNRNTLRPNRNTLRPQLRLLQRWAQTLPPPKCLRPWNPAAVSRQRVGW